MRRRLIWLRLTSGRPSTRLATRLALRQAIGSPGVRRVTFTPHTRRIYDRPVRMAAGFGSLCLLAHRQAASYAVRVPRAGVLPAASFPPRLAAVAVAVRLGIPAIWAPRGLSPPSHFPIQFPSSVDSADHGAARHARRTKKGPPDRRAFQNNNPGNVLLSHAVPHAVPSALRDLTAVFGMGTGVTPSL